MRIKVPYLIFLFVWHMALAAETSNPAEFFFFPEPVTLGNYSGAATVKNEIWPIKRQIMQQNCGSFWVSVEEGNVGNFQVPIQMAKYRISGSKIFLEKTKRQSLKPGPPKISTYKNNVIFQIPPKGKSIKWKAKDHAGDNAIFEASMTEVEINGEVLPAVTLTEQIIFEGKTPPELKSVSTYLLGFGLKGKSTGEDIEYELGDQHVEKQTERLCSGM